MLQHDVLPKASEFLDAQCHKEEHLNWFSAPFLSVDKPLLPGMYSMPIHAVPKLNSTKLHMVINYSTSLFALNTMILQEPITIWLDNIQDLGHNLLVARHTLGNTLLWLFKSNVSQAYHHMPLYPLWQLCQVVIVNGICRIDQCNNFSNRAAGKIWCMFMSLIL